MQWDKRRIISKVECLWEFHENIDHILELGRPKTSDGVPTTDSRETFRTAPGVVPKGNIMEHRRVRIERRIHKPNTLLTLLRALRIDQCKYRTHNRSRSRCSIDQAELAVDSDSIIDTIGRHIWVTALFAGVVVLFRGVRGLVALEVFAHRCTLITWHRENVREATTRKDDFVGCAFGIRHLLARVHFRRTNRRDVRTCSGESGIEFCARVRRVTCVRVDAFSTIPRNTEITGRENESDTH